jgi:Holliday junction resolvase RusA-like endonuclease
MWTVAEVLSFTIYGVPVPKGSMKAFVPKGWSRAVMTNDSSRTRPWQEAVTCAALEARGDRAPIEEPVALWVRFFLPRPKSAPRRVTEPAKKPDLDKLLRSLKDGLTRAGIYRDDSQVVVVAARKEFAGGDGLFGVPRAYVEVGLASTARVELRWCAQPETRPATAGEVFG